MKVGEVMTTTIHTIGKDQSLDVARHTMHEYGIRHLPVLNGGILYGILSDRDVQLVFAVDGAAGETMKISDACTTEVYAVTKDEPLKKVVNQMAVKGIGCAVIIERDRPIGIFTATDACRVLGEVL